MKKRIQKKAGLDRVCQRQKAEVTHRLGFASSPDVLVNHPSLPWSAPLGVFFRVHAPMLVFSTSLGRGVPKVDIIKPALWFCACLGSVLMVLGINRIASSHASPTRARSMALHTESQFCLTRTATGGRLLLSLCHAVMRSLPARRANANAALGTWLAVGNRVGARRTERAIGVCQKWAIMCHGMSAFLV